MNPQQVIAMLGEPSKLMRRAYLSIGGSLSRCPQVPNAPLPPADGQAPIATFKVTVEDWKKVTGFALGESGRTKPRVFVKIAHQDATKAAAALSPDEFNAYYIPMVQTEDVRNGRSHYTLPVGYNALEVMITSRMSGCAFGIGMNDRGDRLVTHVQPDKSLPKGQVRSEDLGLAVGFRFHREDGSFRSGWSYGVGAAVIGRRSGNRWAFYCQDLGTRDGQYDLLHINGLVKIKPD